ncbi:hypothetical protein Y032_0014g2207 [Ancylostoma ceylanicum]|nr:hypothetical protein Y032_0014g2207 [Ancylostoma ceylanicum]
MTTSRISCRSPTSHSKDDRTVVDPWLVKADFYHGYLPREDIVYLLKKHGDFLVRTSELDTSRQQTRPKKKETVISVLMDPEGKFEETPSTESRHDMVCRSLQDGHHNKIMMNCKGTDSSSFHCSPYPLETEFDQFLFLPAKITLSNKAVEEVPPMLRVSLDIAGDCSGRH